MKLRIRTPMSMLVGVFLSLSLWACSNNAGSQASADNQVVLYSSVDSRLLQQVVRAFESTHDIDVQIVGDNEAIKTTGLVQRLAMEKANPRADVWWSSEPFGTIRLQEEGVLEPRVSESAEASIATGWPSRLKGACWYGFAMRSRVIAYAIDRVPQPPRSVVELVDPAWKGRVGMARPAFGTTRGHMGILLVTWGEEGFRAWLEAMKANGLRLYDGNASVARAIRIGEIDVGLADTDDVWAAKRNGWNLGLVFESTEPVPGDSTLTPTGPIVLPNTVSIVKDGPHPDNAAVLMDYLLSPQVEELMANSESQNIPVHPSVASEFKNLLVDDALQIDYEKVAHAIPQAMQICDEVLGSP